MFFAYLIIQIAITGSFAGAPATPTPTPTPPVSIQSRLKPAAYKKLTQDREILTNASLDDAEGPFKETGLKHYSFYSAFLVHATRAKTKRILTDYPLYQKLVPYVDQIHVLSGGKIVSIEGGIWKFRLASTVRFEDRGDNQLHYEIVAGHFTGLEGDIFFESYTPEDGRDATLVYFTGSQDGSRWPPKFVITNGAEIVFGFTARHMRSFIESDVKNVEGQQQQDTPKPRSRL